MCGIIVYLGGKQVVQILVDALHYLEYRGYDSSGIAVGGPNKNIVVNKSVGTVSQLEVLLRDQNLFEEDGFTYGMGHTRWPTTGAVTQANAQPLASNDGTFAAVLNGIIENHQELIRELTSLGYTFHTENDAEVIPILMQHYIKSHPDDILQAFVCMLSKLQGAYAVCVLHQGEETAYCACLGSPMCIGVKDGVRFVASDPMAFRSQTDQVLHLDDNEISVVTPGAHRIYHMRASTQEPATLSPCRTAATRVIQIPFDIAAVEKGMYEHFMLKEIHEQPTAVGNAMAGKIRRLEGIHITPPDPLRQVVLLACGTSFYASLIGRHLIETHAETPAAAEYASEFIYRRCLLGPHDLVVAVSQSGETADTRAALAKAIERGAVPAGIVNVVGSQIARMAGQGMYLHAGVEIGVASTKAFTCQVTAMLMLAAFLSADTAFRADVARILPLVPRAMEQILRSAETARTIDAVTAMCRDARNALYLGRGIDYPVALEGALKLKEISYIHAEGYPAGEMKHGPIALVDAEMPVFFVVGREATLFTKVVNNMEEIKARGGRIITITDTPHESVERLSDHVITVPFLTTWAAPLLKVIPLQLIAYRIAVAKGLNPDRPRNLAKSVTVE